MFQQLVSAAREGAVILTANQRLTRVYRRVFDDHQRRSGLRAWSPPRILPWGAWVHSLWFDAVMNGDIAAATKLSAEQAEAVWREIVDQSPESADILQLRTTAVSAMSAWSLLQQYQIPWKRLTYGGHEDWMTFTGWAREFEKRCQQRGWIDDTRVAGVVTAGIEAGQIGVPRRVLLGGFDEFTPQQSAMLEALRAAGCGWEQLATATERGSAVRMEELDRAGELRAAARWARAIYQANPKARVGVVLPALSSHRALAERIFGEVFHPDRLLSFSSGRAAFHISLGQPLDSFPAVHAALLALKLLRPRLPLAEASAILRSPYLRGGRTEAAERALLDARLRRGRPVEVRTSAIDRWGLAGSTAPREQTAAEWAKTFATLLESVGWPGDAVPSSVEFQSLQAWDDLLVRFASLDLVTPPLSENEAYSRLREMAAATEFQPEDPDAPVQITGALEAAGAAFDHLWIAGLDDESWPQGPHPHPFIPPSLQLEHGLPHCSAAREYEFAARTTERLFASAPQIVVSHARRDGDRVLRPSIFIRGIACREWPQGSDEYATLLGQRTALEVLNDHQAPGLAESETRGGARILKYQAECPFKAFGEFRLKAKALEAGSLGVDPLEHGSALHRALELFWNAVRSHARLTAMTPAELAGLLRDVSVRAVDAALHPPSGVLERRFHDLEIDRVESVLSGWLNAEMAREPFEVVCCEDKRDIDIGGLRISTRVDRVDQLVGSGEFVVIDYKTRAPSPKAWEGDRIDEPQVPLYATSIDDRVGGVAFGQLLPGELKFKGCASASGVFPQVKGLPEGETLTERIAEWRKVLESLAKEFVKGHAVVDPKKNACNFCGLTALCRVHEQEAAGDGV